MGRNAHGEQLVGAKPQRVKDCRIELGERPVDTLGQDGVVHPLAAQCP
ncbi:hypothetical protein AHiyo8_10390 [Arthrobacter sp. Hiyo8]|nr:hypothetical protein AHiyo8_10390 [Arthrobacter sp. Hiyo8]